MGNIKSSLKHNLQYIKNLSKTEKDIIYAYTIDNKILNVNSEYKTILETIINNAPESTSTLTVYRGIRLQIANDLETTLSSFVSTSLSKHNIYDFIKNHGCCALVINLQPGSRFLYVKNVSKYKSEDEILLPPGGKFILTRESYEKVYSNEYDKMYSIKVLYITYIPKNSKNIN
jgi:hypothetical protein